VAGEAALQGLCLELSSFKRGQRGRDAGCRLVHGPGGRGQGVP